MISATRTTLTEIAAQREAGLRDLIKPSANRGTSTSTNWSGYAVDGTDATQVIGTWTEPAVTCGATENSWSSLWVGIDGDTSNTVEQIGTDSDCDSGTPTYYAWYELYLKSEVNLAMTVSPGDSMTARSPWSTAIASCGRRPPR